MVPAASGDAATPATGAASPRHVAPPSLAVGALAALGVVYGDIGTSPLYTMQAVFGADAAGVPLTPAHVIGVVSTILWALVLVVTLKYVVIILRADHHGEGGILALASLAAQTPGASARRRSVLLLMGVAGATLFYGDSVITPAISVLGAVEGLEVVAPGLTPWLVPLAVGVLLLLFAVQRHGTAKVGRAFGPVMLLWFLALALSGAVWVLRQPAILAAFNPLEALRFLVDRGPRVWLALGAIVLALTGAEALYADLGHFGRRPIQWAWSVVVLPALALNYLGQGALLLQSPQAVANPFFHLFPAAWGLPMVVLATVAAIIASQAVISGAFSMTRQAIQLGFLPRLGVKFTSARDPGQVYLPVVNVLLLAAVLLAVLGFRSSAALAGAYGMAVTLTMLLTTVLAWFVAATRWPLPWLLRGALALLFLSIDLMLVAGTSMKLFDGGCFPLAIGAVLFGLMSTWAEGRAKLLAMERQSGMALHTFLQQPRLEALYRPHRTAVYLVADPELVPAAMLHNLKHNEVLHERNLIVHVSFQPVPWVGMAERVTVTGLGAGFWRITVRYGFMNVPDVPKALGLITDPALALEPLRTSWFLSRPAVVVAPGGGPLTYRNRVFAAMSRTAGSAATYFRLPDNAVVELGSRVRL